MITSMKIKAVVKAADHIKGYDYENYFVEVLFTELGDSIEDSVISLFVIKVHDETQMEFVVDHIKGEVKTLRKGRGIRSLLSFFSNEDPPPSFWNDLYWKTLEFETNPNKGTK